MIDSASGMFAFIVPFIGYEYILPFSVRINISGEKHTSLLGIYNLYFALLYLNISLRDSDVVIGVLIVKFIRFILHVERSSIAISNFVL